VVPLSVFFWSEKISFSNLLETLDSDRGPWDLDLSAKMEVLDPSRAEMDIPCSIYAIINISISQLRKGLESPFLHSGQSLMALYQNPEF